MMDIRVRPFKAAHLKQIAGHIIEPNHTKAEWHMWADYNAASSQIALTAFHGRKILACAGVRYDNTLWATFHEDAQKHVKALLFAARELVGYMVNELDMPRLLAHVAEGFPAGERLLKHLGFEPTGEREDCGLLNYKRVV